MVVFKYTVLTVLYEAVFTNLIIRGVTQFGRVLGLGPRCRRFKSCHLDHEKSVA